MTRIERIGTAIASRGLFRWVQLGALGLFLAFQVAAFVNSRAGGHSTLDRLIGPVDRLAYWHFFTVARKQHTAYRFEGSDGTEWRALPMEKWFPARWESGYRWYALGGSRDVALPMPNKARATAIQQAFLEGACERSALHETRLVQVVWKKVLGAEQRQPTTPETKVMATRTCSR